MSDDNTRRHWHGTPGDRHQQLNVWMNGGAKSPSGRAAWAMPIIPGTDNRRVGHLPLRFQFLIYHFPSIIPLALHHYYHYYHYPSIYL